MAKVKISAEEDWKYTHGQHKPIVFNIRIAILLAVIVAFVVAGIIVRQYLFSSFVIVLCLMFFWASRYGMHAIIDRRHFLNRFWREEIDVEFSERIFKIAIGMNKLTLAVADIDRLTRHDDYYSIYHDCGLFLILPKRFLTGEEITLLDSYKSMVDKRDRGKKFYNFLLSRYQRVTPDDKEH